MKDYLSLCFPIGMLLCGAGAATLWSGGVLAKYASKDAASTSAELLEMSQLDSAATYYVFVSELETYGMALDGNDEEDWDDDDDAPDLFYTVLLQGKKIFKSTQRDDCFIANWRGVTVPIALKDLSSVVKGDVNLGIEFEKIITAARVKGNANITIKMFDNDSLSPTDDVGQVAINVAELKEGTNEIINHDRREGNGWKRLEVKVVKREGSVKDYLLPLLREMSKEQMHTVK